MEQKSESHRFFKSTMLKRMFNSFLLSFFFDVLDLFDCSNVKYALTSINHSDEAEKIMQN